MRPNIPMTQDQLVKEKLGMKELKVRQDITEKIQIPGLENLHLKGTKEIAETLAMVIKSRVAIKSLTYVVGQYIEITSESDTRV